VEKINLGIIYGGKSSEHEVSLRTAFSILNAMDYDKYSVIPFYIRLDGQWVKGKTMSATPNELDELRLDEGSSFDLFTLKREIDIVFPVVHGPFGEDGTLQGLLEMLDVPYVGCGVLASSAGMDKVLMKNVFKAEGLPQCEYLYFERGHIQENSDVVLNEIEEKLGYPCFVKPANLGSSVGIGKAKDREGLLFALLNAAKFDRRIIVEEFVEGREVEIGILGNGKLRTSAIGEIFSVGEFYDYSAKYKNIGTKLQIPAELPSYISEEIAVVAKQAFASLDASGLSRIDFFYDEKRDRILINEINTMPGFTSFSMYPMLFNEIGVDYQTLIVELIELGMQRYNDKKGNQISAEDFNKNH